VQEMVEDVSSAGRRCLYPGCTTDLSIYNSDVLCWTHADEKTRALFERRSAGSTAQRLRYQPRKEGQTTALGTP
jgi:hypothetical protein